MAEASAPNANDHFSELLARIERRERRARSRAIFYSALPVALAIALLGYTAHQVRSAAQQVETLRAEADRYQAQSEALQKQVEELEAKLADATNLAQFVRPIDMVDVKEIASRFPGQERLLLKIMQLKERGVQWHLGGQAPEEGFDSPSFAMYILEQLGLPGGELQPGETLLESSRRLLERLPRVDRPRTGDLVFYPAGYALFYFDDPREGAYVLGMTPFGITALKPDFARQEAFRSTRQ